MNYIYKLMTVLLLASLTYNCGVMQQEDEYYPLDAGMSWEYNVTIKFPPIYGGDINTLMEVVNLPKQKFEKVEVIPQRYTLKGTKDLTENVFFEFIGLDKEGMFIYAEKFSMDTEPQILGYRNYFIKHALKVGDNWQCDHESYNSRSSLVSKGTVTVPVGNFDNCLKIKEEGVREMKKDDILWRLLTLGRGSSAKIRFESTYWYAPGVGVVKFYGSEEVLSSERRSRWDTGNIFGKMKVEVHFELTSYNNRGRRQALKKIPLIEKGHKSLQTVGDTDIIAFIHKHTKALQDEDLETYMATLDENSPNYALTLQQARLHFDMYDVVHKFEDIEVMEKSDQYAKVKLVHTVKKLKGPEFRDVKCTEIHTLKKVRGRWKIYKSEATDIELLDHPKEYEYRKKIKIQYSDDFSSDIGWTNETSGDFTIRDGRLNWNAKRSKVQKMYMPIEGYSGDFKVNFDFQLTHRQNNVWLEVGLAESLTGAQNDPANDPIGTFIKFGWIGGGTPYSVYYVIPLARYSNQGAYEGNFDFRNPSTYIAYTEDQWYSAMLEMSRTSWRLTVKDSRGQQVGQRTGSFPDGFGVYKYIYIGNPDNEDWPEGNGYLDNLKVKRLSSQPSLPGPPSDLNGVAVPKYKVKLEWQASSPGNPAKYNIYYDNGNGKINYNQSIGTVPHPTTTWISPALSKGITYKFGVRAENESGEEEKNADVVVSVKVIPLRQLTLQSGRDTEPCWSPGGSKIFYSSNYNIWEMNSVDGSGKKQITQKGGEGPDCSSDNTQIVFMSNRNGERNVWITNIDGSAQQILTTESANYGPTWSPDGQEIAFASRRWRNGKIWRMKPDGSDQQHLTTGWSDDWAPDYSPDGSRIVFASIRTGKIHVWVMNADGSGQRQLTFDPGDKTLATHGWSGPVWSPDGRFIAFAHGIDSNHDNKIDWRDNDNIWTMNTDGSKIFPITFSYSYDDENPAWSPDGTKIAFASTRSGNRDIWVTDYLYDSAAFPSTNIVSPIMNQVINGDVPIIGTVSNNTSVDGVTVLSLLSSWKLEYGEGTSPTQLIPIKNSSIQLINNTLAIWHTAGLTGTYTVQLTATDGKDFNVQRVVVNIQ